MAFFNRVFDRLFSHTQEEKNLEKKRSAVADIASKGIETAWVGLGAPRWTTKSYDQWSQEGYRKNVIVYRCVRIVAESAASIPLILFKNRARLDRHPLLDILAHPNALQSGKQLLETFYSFLLLSGNGYLERVDGVFGQPKELYVLRPDRISIIPGSNGWPQKYIYQVGEQKHSFAVDKETGRSPIFHLKNFHPQSDHYGLSPLEAAAFGVDIHNAAQGWNKALFDNAARPSGALVYEPKDNEPGSLSDEQFSRLKDELYEQYQGVKNAARPLLLEGGLKWQQIALSPQDMEFINSKHTSSREIALAFGVPPMLLGIPGDNTYANYAEANRALWRLTLLPLIEKLIAGLNSWLMGSFDEDLRLDINRDTIPALQTERDILWKRVEASNFLTINEKREMLGFSPLEDCDQFKN